MEKVDITWSLMDKAWAPHLHSPYSLHSFFSLIVQTKQVNLPKALFDEAPALPKKYKNK